MSDDEPDSGHPTPRDSDAPPVTPRRPFSPKTSTPASRRAPPPRLSEHFQGFGESLVSTNIPRSRRSTAPTDSDAVKIRECIQQERKDHEAKKREHQKLQETLEQDLSEISQLEEDKKDLEERLNTTMAEKKELEEEVAEGRKQVTAVQFNLNERNIDLEAAKRTIEEKEELLLAKEQALVEAERLKADLEQQLAETRALADAKEAATEGLRSDLLKAKEKETKQQDHLAALQKQVNQTHVRWMEDKDKLERKRQEEAEKWEEERREMQEQLRQEKARFSTEQNRLTDLVEKRGADIDRLQQELDAKREEWEKEAASLDDRHRAEMEKEVAKKNGLVLEKEKLQETIRAAEKERGRLDADVAVARAEVDRINKRLFEEQNRLTDLEEKRSADIDRLQQEMDAKIQKWADERSSLVSRLREEVENREAQEKEALEAARKQVDQTQANWLEDKKWKKEAEKWEEDRRKMQEQLGQEKERFSTEQNRLTDLVEKRGADIDRLQQELDAKREEWEKETTSLEDRHRAEVEKEVTKEKDLLQEKENLKESLRAAEEEKMKLEKDVAKAQDAIDRLTKKMTTIETELRVAQEQCEAKDKQLAEGQDKIKNIENQSTAERRELEDELRAKIGDLAEAKLIMEQELIELQEKYEQDSVARASLEEEVKAALQKAGSEAERASHAMRDLDGREKAVLEREEQLRNAREHLDLLQKERQDLSNERADLYKRLSAHSKDQLKLQAENEAQAAKITQLASEIEQLVAVRNQLVDLTKAHQQEKEKMQKREQEMEERGREAEEAERRWKQLDEEHTRLKVELGQGKSQLQKTEETLADARKAQTSLQQQLSAEERRSKEYKAMSDGFAEKQLQDSATIDQLQREQASLQRKATKAEEKAKTSKNELAAAQRNFEEVSEQLKEARDNASRRDELEKLNRQLTAEVDYMRVELKSRPSATETQALREHLEVQEKEVRDQATKEAEKEEELRRLRRVAECVGVLESEVQQKEEEIEAHRKDLATLQKEVEDRGQRILEEQHSKAVLAEEFRNFHDKTTADIEALTAHAHRVEQEKEALLAVPQRPESPRFDLEKASVWDAVPISLRAMIPQEVQGALKALRVDRSDAASLADSQVNVLVSTDRLISALEKYYRERLDSSDNLHNVLQTITRLLYNVRLQPESVDTVVERFASDTHQLLTAKEKRLKEQIALHQREVAEERQARIELHRLRNESDLANIKADEERRRLQMSYDASERAKERYKADAAQYEETVGQLRDQLSELRRKHDVLQGEITRLKIGMTTAIGEIKEGNEERDLMAQVEGDLRRRIERTEAEVQRLSRDNLELETRATTTALSAKSDRARLTEAKENVAKMQKRLEKEEETKRFNQQTMRKTFAVIDQLNEYTERLKRRNWQRQRVLDHIQEEVEKLDAKKKEVFWKQMDMDVCAKRSVTWRRDDEKDELDVTKIRNEYSQMISERGTDMVREVKAEKKAAPRSSANKENHPAGSSRSRAS